MFAIRVLACDVDGTLIGPDGVLPSRNLTAVQATVAAGVHVVLATIRKRDTAEMMVEQLGIRCALICEGGASIYDADGVLVRRHSLPDDVASAIATLADQYQFPLATTVDEVNYCGPGYEPGLLLGGASIRVPSNQEAVSGPVSRMVVRDSEAVELIAATFSDAALHIVRHYRTDGTFIDGVITHRDATKANGVSTLLTQWGLRWADVMAIGDAEADIAMIERARIGVAVANATAPVRDVADFVTLSASEAGVADAIERFGLDSVTRSA
jgi:HAD superfamily hydrolase (TIGR01484 family)